jgi:hypothetical protein
MKTANYFLLMMTCLMLASMNGQAHPRVKIVSGMLVFDDGTSAPNEKKYAAFTDSLDRNLKSKPNDTTSLFYRSFLYLKFNSMVAKPDQSTSQPSNNLEHALDLADLADSLNMQDLKLKVLKAQLCKELTFRHAPMDAWRYNAKQITERKKKYEYYKALANKYYDRLTVLDSRDAYDFQRLKIK